MSTAARPSVIAIDTSVAIPLLVTNHRAHQAVLNWWRGRELALSGHALVETYSVLTRLPAGLRLSPGDAALLLTKRFAPPIVVPAESAATLPTALAVRGISGGAAYDAMIALAAREHDCVLATRDLRAKATYDAVGVRSELVS
jgi:toxin FitB